MFKYRVISFPLLLALLAAMVWWNQGKYIFYVLAPVTVGLAVYEAGKLLIKCDFPSFSRTAAIFSAVMTLCCCLFSRGPLLFLCFLLPVLLVPALFLTTLFAADRKEQLVKAAGTAGLLYFIALPLLFSVWIYLVSGVHFFLFYVLITKAMDTGGYVVGMLTAQLPGGNHKIVPSISPKKSWEGCIGGIALSLFAAWGINSWLLLGFKSLPLFLFAVLLALGSFAGDLTESVIKRAAAVKDSNAVIPGMGGVFDVVDSFLYNGILFFLLRMLLK